MIYNNDKSNQKEVKELSKVQVKDKELFIETIKEFGGYNAVASMVGCSQTMLSLMAKGVRNPSPVIAVNFCAVTNKKFDNIFFIDSNYKSNQNKQITK